MVYPCDLTRHILYFERTSHRHAVSTVSCFMKSTIPRYGKENRVIDPSRKTFLFYLFQDAQKVCDIPVKSLTTVGALFLFLF